MFDSDQELDTLFGENNTDQLDETKVPKSQIVLDIGSESVPMATLDKSFALKFIPEYNGSRDELQKFVNCCDLIDNDQYSASDKLIFLNIVKSKLTGNAYNVIKYKDIRCFPFAEIW